MTILIDRSANNVYKFAVISLFVTHFTTVERRPGNRAIMGKTK